MPYIELIVEAAFDETGEQAFINGLSKIEGVGRIQNEPPLALDAAMTYGIEVDKVDIPTIIPIAQMLRDKPRMIRFRCPETRNPVRIRFEGNEDEEIIAERVTSKFTAECGK